MPKRFRKEVEKGTPSRTSPAGQAALYELERFLMLV